MIHVGYHSMKPNRGQVITLGLFRMILCHLFSPSDIKLYNWKN